MRTESKIIVGSAGLGLLFWLLDAVLGYFVWYDSTFLALLIAQVPPQSIYVRVSVLTISVVYGIVIATVITRRGHAEVALRESESLLRTIAAHYPNAYVSIIEADYTVGFTAGQEFAKQNLDPNLFIGLTLEQVFGDQAPLVRQHYEAAFRGEHRTFELYINEQHQLYRIVPLVSRDATIRRLLAVVENVTERKAYETALRESEEKYRALYNNAPLPYQSLDADGHFLDVNPAWLRTLGYQRDEVIGAAFADFLHPDWQPHFAKNFPAFKRRGYVKDVQFRIRHKDGHYLEISFEGCIGYAADGSFKQTYCVFQDITERLDAERALANSEALQRTILDSLGEAMHVVDDDLRILHYNRAFAEWSEKLGFDADPLGKRLDHVYTFLPESVVDEYRWVLETGKVVITQEETMFAGELVATETKKLPVISDGQITGVVTSMENVTERRKAEKERERLLAQVHGQAQQLADVMSTVPEGVLVLDALGEVVLANPNAEKYLQLLTGAPVGSTLTRLGGHPLSELLTSTSGRDVWHEVQAVDRLFEVTARPMANGPELENWVLVIRDVTHERQDERLRQQQARLASVGQLAAGIAHDFNNILAVIMLYVQMSLRTPEISDQLRDRLLVVDEQAKQASELVQQILDFGGRALLDRRPFDLRLLLERVVVLLGRTLPDSIQLLFACEGDAHIVDGDPTRVQQAVVNLVVNARDAMLPMGGGKLHIALSESPEVGATICTTCAQPIIGDWVRIDITDLGGGISPDVLPHIFEPFFTTKAIGEGTGLGLAQVYGIVKQHDGHITVMTETGIGTTFSIYLPAFVSALPEGDASVPESLAYGNGETILVVEDNLELRSALMETVEQLGYQVIIAADGRQALEVLAECGSGVSLVLTDWVMPDMGGEALFRALQQRGLEIPVVILSGHAIARQLEELKAQGLAGWMLKPPDIGQLSQLLARVLANEALPGA